MAKRDHSEARLMVVASPFIVRYKKEKTSCGLLATTTLVMRLRTPRPGMFHAMRVLEFTAPRPSFQTADLLSSPVV